MSPPKRRKWTQVTTGRVMALVLLLAVALGLSIPAIDVYRTRPGHVHSWVDVDPKGTSLACGSGFEAPFWPCYWRRLLGRPWRYEPLCQPTPGREVELCEYAHPEIRMEIGSRVAYQGTGDQGDRIREIEAQMARDRQGSK